MNFVDKELSTEPSEVGRRCRGGRGGGIERATGAHPEDLVEGPEDRVP